MSALPFLFVFVAVNTEESCSHGCGVGITAFYLATSLVYVFLGRRGPFLGGRRMENSFLLNAGLLSGPSVLAKRTYKKFRSRKLISLELSLPWLPPKVIVSYLSLNIPATTGAAMCRRGQRTLCDFGQGALRGSASGFKPNVKNVRSEIRWHLHIRVFQGEFLKALLKKEHVGGRQCCSCILELVSDVASAPGAKEAGQGQEPEP